MICNIFNFQRLFLLCYVKFGEVAKLESLLCQHLVYINNLLTKSITFYDLSENKSNNNCLITLITESLSMLSAYRTIIF